VLIKTLRVQNFRSLKDVSLEVDCLTALVGPNGCGKSALLRALELFYASSLRLSMDDFYNRDTTRDIVVSVTFADLQKEAQERFAAYLDGSTLTVERVITWEGGKLRATYHGSRLSNPEFAAVRSADKAADKKHAYEALAKNAKYASLPAWKNQTDGLRALEEWEQGNAGALTRMRDSGQFFGFTEVGQGYLGDFTKLLFIPAVRDASVDAEERRGSVLSDLLDLVVRSVLANKEAVRRLREDTQRQYADILDPSKLTELTGLSAKLTATLDSFAPGAMVNLLWQPLQQVEIPMPKADVRLIEDEFEVTVERTGHGLQRAFVVTMLQHLALAQRGAGQVGEDTSRGDSRGTGRIPNLVLVIEEPELYQHPNRQRHLAQVLAQLAGGLTPGVADVTQIIYATHAPIFVGVDRFDQVRLLRKEGCATGPKTTQLSKVTLDAVAERVWEANGRIGDKYTGHTLRARLLTLMTPWMSEGFFAEVVVLVEGEDDRAALVGTATALNIEFERIGVSIIPCLGKQSMDRPAIIFGSLGIKTYLVWDGDEGEKDARPEDNHRLLRLLAAPVEDWPSGIFERYACFRTELEDVMREELGADDYGRWLRECQAEHGIPKKAHALKNPAVVAGVLKKAREANSGCQTLEEIVRRIVALRDQ
jgi:energy-coupling factor transporter ATP-binding protein EcfA2